jgi:hypothetical protein
LKQSKLKDLNLLLDEGHEDWHVGVSVIHTDRFQQFLALFVAEPKLRRCSQAAQFLHARLFTRPSEIRSKAGNASPGISR